MCYVYVDGMIMIAVIGLMNDCGFMVAVHDDCGVVVVIVIPRKNVFLARDLNKS